MTAVPALTIAQSSTSIHSTLPTIAIRDGSLPGLGVNSSNLRLTVSTLVLRVPGMRSAWRRHSPTGQPLHGKEAADFSPTDLFPPDRLFFLVIVLVVYFCVDLAVGSRCCSIALRLDFLLDLFFLDCFDLSWW